MNYKKILGLDLGSNSIGGALIDLPSDLKEYGISGEIKWLGSRIIPIESDSLKKFESEGQVESKASLRRTKRGNRRLKHRFKLRRSRLIRVLKILGWLDEDCPLDDPKFIKRKISEEGYFRFNIDDYLPISKNTINEAAEILGVEKNKNGNLQIPQDWVLYYLRKKALSKKITLQELARILLMLNQRRGFKSSRKDLKDTQILEYSEFLKVINKIKEEGSTKYFKDNIGEVETKFVSRTRIKSVEKISNEKDKKGNYTFEITAEDRRLLPWEVKRKQKPPWQGKEVNLLITQKIKKDGSIKQLTPQTPSDDDWNLNLVALDNEIGDKTPGEYFWGKIVKDRNFKIKQNVVRREKYQKELDRIWQKQLEIRQNENKEQELLNEDKLDIIAHNLYKRNRAKQTELVKNGLLHIFSNDIIFYQRELKSQKRYVNKCRFETHTGIDGNVYGVNCAPKSSPEFQEFRIWQQIHNLKIFEKEVEDNGVIKVNVDITSRYLTENVKEKLFEKFDNSEVVTQKDIFKIINESLHQNYLSEKSHWINLFSNDNKLKGNETKALIRRIFESHGYKAEASKYVDNPLLFRRIWHVLYSISSSDIKKAQKGIKKALSNLGLPGVLIDEFAKLPEMDKKYASFSSKAIKKMLPLMRCGKYWNLNNIEKTVIKITHEQNLLERIDDILQEKNKDRLPNKFYEFVEKNNIQYSKDFRGLPTYITAYIVYGKHSENQIQNYSIDDIRSLDVMKIIPNNSLRNPIVEKVIRETVMLTKEICKKYGKPDEIHIELARELKKNSDEKKKITELNRKNLEEKRRVKVLLEELMNTEFDHYDADGKLISKPFYKKPNPENPSDIEKFRIYKSCGGFSADDEKQNWDTLFQSGKTERVPSKNEIKKYVLWMSQKCISPYTGKVIPLSKLFTEEYEIEHVIPRKKLKNDSMNNLIICESGVNKAKGNKLAAEFINSQKGQCRYGNKIYSLFSYDEYVKHCKKTFSGGKLSNLLATEVPKDFISRQINETRYISKKVSQLLAPFCNKSENGIVFSTGSVTHELKLNWGLNEIWKDIIKPRFERLEKISGEKFIIKDMNNPNMIHFNVPGNEQLDIKRIDHRHHALDALIVAATTREHVRLLNSLHAVDSIKDLNKIKYALVKKSIRDFKLPWPNFNKEAKEKLEETIAAFKHNKRIISKPYNRYYKWFKNQQGQWEKKLFTQKPNKRWLAVRKSMFKEPQGIIHIKEKKYTKNISEAFEIQIQRIQNELNNLPTKTLPYIYDHSARKVIKTVIEKFGIPIENKIDLMNAVNDYLKRNMKKVPTSEIDKRGKTKFKKIYTIEGLDFEKILIAHFSKYKVKRVRLDSSFDHKKINKIPYANSSRIPILLHEHLQEYERKKLNDQSYNWETDLPKLNSDQKRLLDQAKEEAFSDVGIDYLSKKIGMPIESVTIMDGKLTSKHLDNIIGGKYLEPDKGAIAYFVIYENEKTKDRPEMFSIPVNKVVQNYIDDKPIVEKKEHYKIILLQTNDLVYVPTNEEWKRIINNQKDAIDWADKKHISERTYRLVKSTGSSCYFLPVNVASLILPYNTVNGYEEFESQNCSEYTIDRKIIIKERCIKLHFDRLTNIFQ